VSIKKRFTFFYGSINPQLAERTGFSDEDALVLKGILPRLFENDASSARPEGSMAVNQVFWWEHNSKAGQFSSAKVHKSLTVKADGGYELDGGRHAGAGGAAYSGVLMHPPRRSHPHIGVAALFVLPSAVCAHPS